ncbi:hypothetical protein GCM10010215_26530 [Streptomyces virginiae]|uniref:Uncharacterized protein n=1 Tax=Streptomyces virginiae TaxID=1961 RepID=A0ABQ3NN15_STRVG|nr:hypothetical protein GCM10010215_26530 [Streptomyces virginiae]GHI14168.1 hypothetical protein Scinn_36310 [Streptomyces virginiae]
MRCVGDKCGLGANAVVRSATLIVSIRGLGSKLSWSGKAGCACWRSVIGECTETELRIPSTLFTESLVMQITFPGEGP